MISLNKTTVSAFIKCRVVRKFCCEYGKSTKLFLKRNEQIGKTTVLFEHLD